MEQAKEIVIALKYAEIDNTPFPNEQLGWVSGLVNRLTETLCFYFPRPVRMLLKNETDPISEAAFKEADAIILVLSPAFMLSSNLAADIAHFEKAFSFNINFINAKIHKVLKGPVNLQELPATISMGVFHHFYQMSSTGDSGYETLFDWDKSAVLQAKYWESFTNLIFDLLKSLQHEKQDRFMPKSDQAIYLGSAGLGQLWNRTNLYGELHSRGVKVLPDHDHSIEVKYLNDPIKFYLEKSTLAIHFPEEFLPLSDQKLNELTAMSSLKRYIWFNPEEAKNSHKNKQYDELKLKLKNLDHIESITSGIEELKEIILSSSAGKEVANSTAESTTNSSIYLIVSEDFSVTLKNSLISLLRQMQLNPLLLDSGSTQQKRLKHYQYLKMCRYCLVCYDGKNPEWVRANINEVKKAAGMNPEKSRKIKLGIVAEKDYLPELDSNNPTYTLLSASAPVLGEALNRFVHE